MKKEKKNIEAFLALVRAGLWEKVVHLLPFGEIAFDEVLYLAEEQSVVGLVAAGCEHVVDKNAPQEILLQFVGRALQLEQRNRKMNDFIASIIEKMRMANIYGLLVKGSGLAQCYERPLWRSCGDIDFLFSKDGYQSAVDFFLTQKDAIQVHNAQYTKSFGVVIDNWMVELHGTLRNCLSSKMDRMIDEVQEDLFLGGHVRSWMNGETQVFLPGADNDVFLVFTHFVRHLYKEGVCLRQMCDWCRLLSTFRDKVDYKLLESRIMRAGLMAEWKSFAALAVDFLGMPIGDMPFYDNDEKWHNKGKKILCFIIEGRKGNTIKDTFLLARLFPLNTLIFSPGLFFFVNWMKIKEKFFK